MITIPCPILPTKIMEYKWDNYRRQSGQILTASDGHKYLRRKFTDNAVYLKCALFRDGCNATAKSNKNTDLITPCKTHNHNLTRYSSEIFQLQRKCKTMARTSQDPLRKIFDDVAREDPVATKVSFSERESSMYRSRRRSHRKYLKMLQNYLLCCRLQPLENSIKVLFTERPNSSYILLGKNE